MAGAVSKSKVKIKNMLPKNHEISSVSGEIMFKKDEELDILCFGINLMDFFQLVFVSGL